MFLVIILFFLITYYFINTELKEGLDTPQITTLKSYLQMGDPNFADITPDADIIELIRKILPISQEIDDIINSGQSPSEKVDKLYTVLNMPIRKNMKQQTPYTTDFRIDTPNGVIANGTVFNGWTVNSTNSNIVSSYIDFYGTSYADPTKSFSASGRNINFTIASGTAGQFGISRSIYLDTNTTYALSFFIGTRTGQYYNNNHYFRGTITNGTSNSTPNPIFNITGMIPTETKKIYTFTVPTSSTYTFSFISGSNVNVADSTYILRNVSLTKSPIQNELKLSSEIINKYTTSIWLDTENPTYNFVLNGNNVTSWLDKTKNGYNLTNVGAIAYNSTSPTSVFIPVNSYFKQTITPYLNMLTSLQTWFFVVSIPEVSSSNMYKIIGLNNSQGGGVDYIILSNKFLIYDHGNTNPDGIGFNITPTANTKYLFSVSLNTSTSYTTAIENSIMRLNGTTQNGIIANTSSSNFKLTGSSSSLAIGAVGVNSYFWPSSGSFNIYEIIGINNQALNINDIKTIEKYLNTKWDLGYTIN